MDIIHHQYEACNLSLPQALDAHQVHCWFFPIGDNSFWLGDFSQILSAEEQHKAQQFYRNDLQQEYRQAHLGKRYILSQYTSLPAAQLFFEHSEYGKPKLSKKTNIDNYHFNLSHSHRWACLAVAKMAVGIDIEHINTQSGWQKLRNMVCHPNDQADDAQAFYRLWTCKEAASKWDGRGLGIEFPMLSLNPYNTPEPACYNAGYRVLHDQEKSFCCHTYPLANPYPLAAAVATEQTLNRVDCLFPVLADRSSHHAQS